MPENLVAKESAPRSALGAAYRRQAAPWRRLDRALRLYGLGSAAFVVLFLTTGDLVPPVALLANFQHLFLAPAPVLAAVALVRRQPLATVALLVAAAAGVAQFGDRLLPRSPAASLPQAGPTLRVVTWNAGLGRSDAPALAATIRELSPDAIALQELPTEQWEELCERLDDYPHRIHAGEDIEEKAIFSRHPIVGSEFVEPPRGRPWLRATIAFESREVTLYDVHFSPFLGALGRWSADDDALGELLGELEPGASVVVLGDFNTCDPNGPFERVRDAGLGNAFTAAGRGLGFTFPVFRRYRGLPVPPVVRIDHIWHSADLVPLRAEVGPDGGSDHLPVVADLLFLR